MNFDSSLAEILARDPRYTRDAYLVAQESIERAKEFSADPEPEVVADAVAEDMNVSGHELCMAFREVVFDRYGMLGLPVVRRWGLQSTRDLGNVVFNLIDARMMRKHPSDSLEDFVDVFDFETAWHKEDIIP